MQDVTLTNLRNFLKIITITGFIATNVLMTALLYRYLEKRYPAETQKFKWAFFVGSIALSLLFIYIYWRLYILNSLAPDRPVFRPLNKVLEGQ